MFWPASLGRATYRQSDLWVRIYGTSDELLFLLEKTAFSGSHNLAMLFHHLRARHLQVLFQIFLGFSLLWLQKLFIPLLDDCARKLTNFKKNWKSNTFSMYSISIISILCWRRFLSFPFACVSTSRLNCFICWQWLSWSCFNDFLWNIN